MKGLSGLPKRRMINASALIEKGPCVLDSATISGDTADPLVKIYDGVDSGGEQLAQLLLDKDTPQPFSFRGPLECREGLYVAVNAATTFVTLTWHKLAENPPQS